MNSLPIHEVLPQVLGALRDCGAGVLVAPPGAGKTTAVAPALLGEAWCDGQVILTSPRRVAARAAAERMAAMLGEEAGGTIGYATRLESRISARTRVLVVTEAILVNRLVEDPELPGVSALLFDEAHERHLDSDLALALALESRAVLREDLRVLVMSATIDGARFARLLGEGAPVLTSEGRSFPLEIKWLGGDASQAVEDRVAGAVMRAWREETGDVLAFLPGLREIERVRERLGPRLPDTPILPLHGQVEPAAQRAAIARDPTGRRRIVLASAIAETSLTLDGVSVVVDSGLARLAEFDPAAGTTHLVTRRASRAAADQRAGRAARQGPGVAYRLWEEAGHPGRPEFAAPEIATADLAPLVLTLARWGGGDPAALPWLDPPPEVAVASARARLAAMGALDAPEHGGRITAWGQKVAALPMAPDHAAALLFAAEAGCEEEAARLVMLLQERGLGGRSEDLAQRLAAWARERGKRAEAARGTAKGWAKRARGLAERGARELDPFECLALARPDFVARRRDAAGEHWLAAGGRGFRLDPASPLARAEWIVIGDAQGQASGARITAGAALAPERVAAIFADRIEETLATDWDDGKNRVRAVRHRRLGAITLTSVPEPSPDPQAVVDILVDKALEKLGTGNGLLPAGFLARARFAGIEALSPEALRESAALWLAPLLEGRRDLELAPAKVAEAALGLAGWDERQRLGREAPIHFTSPAGTRHAIDYAGEDAPSVEVRVQALFGLDAHPMIGGVPLLLKLTSPAGRPVQATRDLPGFWRGSWLDVAKDMKGRYPKHRWPERPWEEKPSLKTKNAFNRG
ncbi:ATP-dependent helicase HrpB [Erythrobacter sp. HL-111]|uniref:ATP-dependent helicase HrpB n=1 Tax=Erythrobacter sp. HL-111 TaxID=1798193 RepID=UPI0006DA1B0E|nr:ATP-dependent helicase HrpB [Erythrobacter sp. HL-111]KPP96243.1 MAG: ATP-dependent helicase HrpB [Erythrobacteraceae bacterium HL-111]SDR76566.1 ATP-dependent helicase HrpB [Erythrobacter sp. HL-111]